MKDKPEGKTASISYIVYAAFDKVNKPNENVKNQEVNNVEKEWNDLEHAKHLLEEGSCTCAMVKGDQQYTSKAHGVKPLLQWYHEGVDLKDFSAADQIVGKAAAFLYLQMGVKELYCKVVSKRGKELLLQSGMPIEYERLVPEIKNRTGDDMCPMERTVEHISDGTEAVEALTRKVQEMMAYH